jgi:hypothetical protein
VIKEGVAAGSSLQMLAFEEGREGMRHVVLLGDSIFDNGRNVPGGPFFLRQKWIGTPTREHA